MILEVKIYPPNVWVSQRLPKGEQGPGEITQVIKDGKVVNFNFAGIVDLWFAADSESNEHLFTPKNLARYKRARKRALRTCNPIKIRRFTKKYQDLIPQADEITEQNNQILASAGYLIEYGIW